jgi:hypothetical protein
VPRDFQVTDGVFSEFRDYLDKEKITYAEADLQTNHDYLSLRIKQDLISAIYGKAEGDRIMIHHDPWVMKALDAMPQAEALEKRVHRTPA